MASWTCTYLGEALGRYHFGEDHPFGPRRYPAFVDEFRRRGLDQQVQLREPVMAGTDVLERFHSSEYVARVQAQSRDGQGFLDYGDTPAFEGVFEAAAAVVGTTLDGAERIMAGDCRRSFTPIGGLHHARRDRAGGFCVFNDCGVVIETLLSVHGLERVAYVDIDAHHGDGVYYAFEDDPRVIIADLHEDGRYLYPGSGFAAENGKGEAEGTKLNIPMLPGAGDEQFLQAWERVETLLAEYPPSLILFQCGADSMAGDPLTDLRYTEASHAHAARRLCQIADVCCKGRILAMGGGGYSTANLARAWCTVLQVMLET